MRRALWALSTDAGAPEREIASATENTPFFDRPDRDKEERPELLMSALQIPRGATVADLGSGTGYFTWRLAQQVGPQGKVYAVDVQQSMLDLTKAAVAGHKLDNVEYVLATERQPRLPERSVDLVFIAYAYHEFGDPGGDDGGPYVARSSPAGASWFSNTPRRAGLRRLRRSTR